MQMRLREVVVLWLLQLATVVTVCEVVIRMMRRDKSIAQAKPITLKEIDDEYNAQVRDRGSYLDREERE